MAIRREKNMFFNRKEELDFMRLCTIHGFKKRKIIKDSENRVSGFEIYLPFTIGSVEKKLSNVARYTKSHRISKPCFIGKQYMIQVMFTK